MWLRHSTTAALLAALLALGAGGCARAPSPTWRARLTGAILAAPVAAPGGAVLVASTDQLALLAAADGKPIWQLPLPQGAIHAPLVAGDAIYLPRADGALVAYDLKGRARWTAPGAGVAFGTPAVGYGLVYLLSERALQAYDPASGRLMWRLPLKDPLPRSLAVDPRHLVFVTEKRGVVSGVDPRTGRVRWRFDNGSALHAPPKLDPYAVLVADAAGRLRAVERQGPPRPRWTYDGLGPVVVTPVAAEGFLYLAAGKRLYALESSLRRWSYAMEAPIDAGPVLVADRVVVANFLGQLVGLDPRTGELRWSRQIDRAAATGLLAAGACCVVVYQEGERSGGALRLVDAATGQDRWALQSPRGFMARPLLSEGRLVAATNGGEIMAFPLPEDAR